MGGWPGSCRVSKLILDRALTRSSNNHKVQLSLRVVCLSLSSAWSRMPIAGLHLIFIAYSFYFTPPACASIMALPFPVKPSHPLRRLASSLPTSPSHSFFFLSPGTSSSRSCRVCSEGFSNHYRTSDRLARRCSM